MSDKAITDKATSDKKKSSTAADKESKNAKNVSEETRKLDKTLAGRIKDLQAKVESGEICPYPLGPTEVYLPPSCFKGRAKYAGKYNWTSKTIRIDSFSDPSFWMEIQLPKHL